MGNDAGNINVGAASVAPPILENVPVELKNTPQWVAWRFIERDGKQMKVPTSPTTGQSVNHTDPTNWRSFDSVARASPGSFADGIAFVFSEDDPFVGVDLDDVLDPETGEIKAWAMDLIQSLNSYAEVSPSGTGVKVFVRGSVPKGGPAKLRGSERRAEVYDRGRFFTLTGRRLPGTPTTVGERQRQLDGTFDFAPSSAATSRSGDGARRADPLPEKLAPGSREPTLYSLAGTCFQAGMDAEAILAVLRAVNERRCEPAKSEAELREVADKIFARGYEPLEAGREPNPRLAAALMRRRGLSEHEMLPGLLVLNERRESPLPEEEVRRAARGEAPLYPTVTLVDDVGGDSNEDATGGGDAPADAATDDGEAGGAETATPDAGEPSSSRPPVSGGRDGSPRPVLRSVCFAEMPPPPDRRPYVIESLVPARYPAMIYGDGGTAKSLLALSVAQAVARGDSDWMGFRIERPGPAYYIDFELDAEEMHRRARHLALGQDPSDGGATPPSLRYLSGAGHAPKEVFRFALEECRALGVELVIVDSMGFALQGDAEAAKDVLGFFREAIDPFRTAGVSVLIVDHQAKMQAGDSYYRKTPFGSAYKRNSIRSEIQVEPTGRSEDELTVRLRHQKVNLGPRFDPFEIRVRFTEAWVRLERTDLDEADLAAEGSLFAADKVRLVLAQGAAYSEDIAEAAEMPLGTVQNAIRKLKKQGVVVPAGKTGNAVLYKLAGAPQESSHARHTGGRGGDGSPGGTPVTLEEVAPDEGNEVA